VIYVSQKAIAGRGYLKVFGPVRIQYELKERGVDVAVNDVFEDAPDWQEVLNELHTKNTGINLQTI